MNRSKYINIPVFYCKLFISLKCIICYSNLTLSLLNFIPTLWRRWGRKILRKYGLFVHLYPESCIILVSFTITSVTYCIVKYFLKISFLYISFQRVDLMFTIFIIMYEPSLEIMFVQVFDNFLCFR